MARFIQSEPQAVDRPAVGKHRVEGTSLRFTQLSAVGFEFVEEGGPLFRRGWTHEREMVAGQLVAQSDRHWAAKLQLVFAFVVREVRALGGGNAEAGRQPLDGDFRLGPARLPQRLDGGNVGLILAELE